MLGSGLGDYADTIRVEAVLDYHDIEGFPVSTVSGHKGRFVFWIRRRCPGRNHARDVSTTMKDIPGRM